PVLKAQPAPDLGWDGVRARVHWSLSKEKHARREGRPSRRMLVLATGGLLAAGAFGIAIATGSFQSPAPLPVATNHEPPPPTPAPAAPTLTGVVSRLTGQVMIDGVRRADAFERALVAGTVLATGDGRVDIQFGDHSAFALGPRSTLELRR